MAPRKASKEFPLLEANGLMTSEITGDGNCLFNALSDQMHGHEGENLAIRAKVIEEMRANPDNYKSFIPVDPRGPGRRNPKRKNKGSASESLQETPTDAQIEAAWQDHLRRMSQSGCYGDNTELVAFTKAYDVNVVVFTYQSLIYQVKAAEDGVKRPILYIALHEFEHYSTVRKIGGPSTGPPEITIGDPEAPADMNAGMEGNTIHNWQVDVVQNSLPTPVEESVIRQSIKQHKGNIDNAVTELLDSQYYSSAPGTPGNLSESGNSSFFEREQESEDEYSSCRNKRRNFDGARDAKKRVLGQQNKEFVYVPLPSVEVTAPDAYDSRHPSPEIPAIQQLRNSSDVASIATSDDDSYSEYTASTHSRAQSVAPGTTPPRPRIILHTASQKAKLARQRQQSDSQEPTSSEPSEPSEPVTLATALREMKNMSARERKVYKKTLQKKQARVRKQEKMQSDSKLTTTSANIKRASPPVDKVLSLGKLSMIQI
ncbi:Cysteine proteinase [Glarea lozoyensis ATCC 20868]|uniref:Cysteine proteinase n=1 Tax=Glarea lozoyensis (strain ATCC 20868 / MF5171) TaxID=1116229 RepID=S3CRQ7_GLAL2|nr:Cysteine proteinase [Glarea lozoyensis ATCC 20868]EPE28340.1 Cysteine proteinase [Glarea lozoyensis ATCC 20868]